MSAGAEITFKYSGLALEQMRALGAIEEPVSDVSLTSIAGVSFPFFCGIMQSPSSKTDVSKVIELAKEKFKTFCWICDRKIDGAALHILFPGMELQLSSLKRVSARVDAIFEWVSDLNEWASVIAPTFEFKSESEKKRFVEVYSGRDCFYHLIARLDGTAVAAGSVQKLGDIAVLHNMVTLEEQRGKGIGAAVAGTLLEKAQLLGCTYSRIQASEKAVPMYQRLGFQSKTETYVSLFSSEI